MSDIHYNCPQRKGFAQSQEATFRRRLRDTVRKSSLTRAEKDITLAFLNHWFVHRHKGPVHPGRKKLAKRSGASIRTVNYTLSLLRDFGAIVPVAFEHGNTAQSKGCATEYTLSEKALQILCETPKEALQRVRQGRLARNTGCKNARFKGANFAPRNKPCTVIAFPVPRK